MGAVEPGPLGRIEAIERENQQLRLRLQEAEETLHALRNGEVDAIVVGNDVYTLEATAAAAQRLRSDVLAQMEEAVVVVDRGGHVIYLNPAAEQQYGLAASKALGLPREHLYRIGWLEPDDERQAGAALRSEGHWRGRQRHTTPAGRVLLVEASVSELRDADGAASGALVVIRDLSGQAAAELALRESRSHLQFALNAAGVGSWELDFATGAVSRSLRHARCFGHDEAVSEWRLQTLLDHVHPEDRAPMQRALDASREAGEEFHVELRVLWPDASEHWVEMHGTLFGGGSNGTPGVPRLARLVGIVFDVTERKRIHAALREADQRKDEFLATLAHELRNPLAPIRNSLQIIRLTREPRVQQTALAMIDRQVTHMVRLVDDLMDVNRITQGKVQLRWETVDMLTVLQDAVDTSMPLIAAKRHRLQRALPQQQVRVQGDPTRLTQVVANLLNNAAKFTPEDGCITLSAALGAQELQVSVEDDGIGIQAEMLPRVFDMFTQFDSPPERVKGGLGIGLALVKRLVELHGGRIEAASAGRDRGARFTVSLPLPAGAA